MIHDIEPHKFDIAYIDSEPENDSAILFFHDSYLIVGQLRNREGGKIAFPTYGEVREKCEKLVYLFRLDGQSFFYYNVDEKTFGIYYCRCDLTRRFLYNQYRKYN